MCFGGSRSKIKRSQIILANLFKCKTCFTSAEIALGNMLPHGLNLSLYAMEIMRAIQSGKGVFKLGTVMQNQNNQAV